MIIRVMEDSGFLQADSCAEPERNKFRDRDRIYG